MTKILIIEDEKPMAEAIKYTLDKEGYEMGIASDGESGWQLCQTGSYELVILDLMLPNLDGLEVLRRIRNKSQLPVIILTAKDSDIDKVIGLELGADDYMTKPFNMRELVARVKTILRRSARVKDIEPSVLEGGGVTINLDRHEVEVRGDIVKVPPVEYRLLVLLLKNSGKAIAREYLLNAGWEGEFYGQNKALDVHISRLRDKVEEDPNNPKLIVTVRGTGYRYDPKP